MRAGSVLSLRGHAIHKPACGYFFEVVLGAIAGDTGQHGRGARAALTIRFSPVSCAQLTLSMCVAECVLICVSARVRVGSVCLR